MLTASGVTSSLGAISPLMSAVPAPSCSGFQRSSVGTRFASESSATIAPVKTMAVKVYRKSTPPRIVSAR